ncbi:hypothetical protein QAD02_012614 [Eretmocerus hayati]|uniref:Uncharacterized protein n=1 Tax=Eretmocerus hayati TaxID=131215 RepID=A0ACC2P310_9HYME|nr:hypothetical protein QAD02_012614 [Eretmocerus hayati]
MLKDDGDKVTFVQWSELEDQIDFENRYLNYLIVNVMDEDYIGVTDHEIDFDLGDADFDERDVVNYEVLANVVQNHQSRDVSSTICDEGLIQRNINGRVRQSTKKKTLRDLKKKLTRLSNIKLKNNKKNLDIVHEKKEVYHRLHGFFEIFR